MHHLLSQSNLQILALVVDRRVVLVESRQVAAVSDERVARVSSLGSGIFGLEKTCTLSIQSFTRCLTAAMSERCCSRIRPLRSASLARCTVEQSITADNKGVSQTEDLEAESLADRGALTRSRECPRCTDREALSPVLPPRDRRLPRTARRPGSELPLDARESTSL